MWMRFGSNGRGHDHGACATRELCAQSTFISVTAIVAVATVEISGEAELASRRGNWQFLRLISTLNRKSSRLSTRERVMQTSGALEWLIPRALSGRWATEKDNCQKNTRKICFSTEVVGSGAVIESCKTRQFEVKAGTRWQQK